MNRISENLPENSRNIYWLWLFTLTLLVFLVMASLTSAADNPQKSKRVLPKVSLPRKTIALIKAGKWSAAIEALTEAYESIGSDPNLKYYLAYCREQLAADALKKRKYQEAINQLEQAVLDVDDVPELYLALGICHFAISQYSEAEVYFKEALALNPKYFLAHKKLGEIYYLTNDNEQAQYHWEEALKLDPADRALKKRLMNLKKFLELSGNFETEIDMFFLVSFDGERDLQLRGNVMDILEDIYLEIGQELNLYPNRQIQVVLLANQEFFDITGSPGWAGGVYEGHIKVPVENYNLDILKIVLCHEYVHAVIYDRLSHRCPWWLNEGLAQYFSGDEKGNKRKLEIAAGLLSKGNVPSLLALPGNWLQNKTQALKAYALALSGVHFFMEKFTIFDMQAILDLMAEGKKLERAVKEITAYTFKEFEKEWKEVR
ncbi:MAG: tetratricopeptide repeat protein [Candidatus Aminicenantes bacterium]|nr:MAG: tetratricopeptide repeat protein [Candidatus Aminicenantes bacterium]